MITFVDIKKAVVELLKSEFQPIQVIAQDVTKGFKRPSFTVILDEPTIAELECTDELAVTVQIYYFPDFKDNTKSIDILDMQYRLPKLIGNKLEVEDRYLDVIDPSSSTPDGVYIYEFNLLFEDEIREDDTELMQDLTLNM